MALTTATNNYANTRFLVSAVAGQGNYTSIQAAINAATAPATIGILPGTYAGDITPKSGVNITGMPSDGSSFSGAFVANNVIISGRVDISNAGDFVLSNVTLKNTARELILANTSNVQSFTLKNCQALATNGSFAIVQNPNCKIDVYNCDVFLQNAVPNFTMANGVVNCYNSNFISDHAGMSTNSSDGILDGTLNYHYCFSSCNVASVFAGPSNFSAKYSEFVVSGTAGTQFSFGVSGTLNFEFCKIDSGSNTAIDIGNNTMTFFNNEITSSNTNAIVGSGGTLIHGGNTFTNSRTITVTTQTGVALIATEGGTGINGVNAGDILYGSAPNTYNLLSAASDGEVLTLSGGFPTWQIPTAFQIPWTDEGSGFVAVSNNGYFIEGTLGATLPASPLQGDIVAFQVTTAGSLTSFNVQANSSQFINIGNSTSSSTGSASNTQNGDAIYLVYRTSDSTWYSTVGTTGNWNLT